MNSVASSQCLGPDNLRIAMRLGAIVALQPLAEERQFQENKSMCKIRQRNLSIE